MDVAHFLSHKFQQEVIGKQEKGMKMHLTAFAYEPKAHTAANNNVKKEKNGKKKTNFC